MRKFVLLGVLLGELSACVIGRPTRPSQIESAQGPLAPTVTGSPVVPDRTLEDGDPPPGDAKTGATWLRGYYHWDGVRSIWQPGHWQKAKRQNQ